MDEREGWVKRMGTRSEGKLARMNFEGSSTCRRLTRREMAEARTGMVWRVRVRWTVILLAAERQVLSDT
jgi:hypothetical protein